MANLLLAYDVPSLLVSSLTNQFEEKEQDVTTSSLSVAELSSKKKKYDAILVFADEDISDNLDALVYLKDLAMENDSPIFVAGDVDELRKVEKTIPRTLILATFTRPINVKNVVDVILAYINDESRTAKKKILVVDDSGAMLRNVKGWLEDKYQIALANSGTMAIKYLTLDKPDLVLLDYEMPVIDGKQVLEMIRSENDFQDIPVIFLTSKSDKQSVIDVMSLKPEGYLLKTMPPEEIVKTVDSFFEKKRLEEVSKEGQV